MFYCHWHYQYFETQPKSPIDYIAALSRDNPSHIDYSAALMWDNTVVIYNSRQ